MGLDCSSTLANHPLFHRILGARSGESHHSGIVESTASPQIALPRPAIPDAGVRQDAPVDRFGRGL